MVLVGGGVLRNALCQWEPLTAAENPTCVRACVCARTSSASPTPVGSGSADLFSLQTLCGSGCWWSRSRTDTLETGSKVQEKKADVKPGSELYVCTVRLGTGPE